MRLFLLFAVLAACATGARAQQPTRPDSARRDSTQRADSLEKARQDSIILEKELERILAEPRARPDPRQAAGAPPQPSARLLPDISAIGDFVGDFSPDGSTLEEGERIGVREVEVALQANVDPYFRADFILGVHADGLEIEEAYATTTALPWGLQARVGRIHLPFGKQNVTHRPELHSIEYPWVIQRFLGAEGGKGDGLYLSKVLAPLGFYQELQVGVMDRFGGEAHGHEEEEGTIQATAAEPANRKLGGLGYQARFRNYWDLSEATNVELSASAATGRVAQPFAAEIEPGVNAVNARQSLYGVDVTYRWRPLQQGLYRSFILQAEVMTQRNERVEAAEDPVVPGSFIPYLGPDRDYTGGYLFARWQLTRRLFVGARADALDDLEIGDNFRAASGYLQWFPSEFSKIVLGYERLMPGAAGVEDENRVLVQATFSVGPHRPHPF